MFSFTTDRTGFPLVVFKSLQLDVQLLPVTKYQFELFLTEPNPFDDRWYETVLDLNPRWNGLPESQPERGFLTGILPTEVMQFATWLGEGYRPPSYAEWMTIYTRFHRASRPADDWSIPFGDLSSGAMRCLDTLLRQDTSSWTTMSKLKGGVMEWVQGRRRWQWAGEPRPSFGSQLFSWRMPVTPTDTEQRNALCGFRLVRDRTRR